LYELLSKNKNKIMKRIIVLSFVCFCISTHGFSQNVGINNANPDRPLTIRASNPNNELISLRDTNNAPLWHLNMLNNGLNFAETGFADGRFFIGSNGKIGIGTTNPDYPLHIYRAGGFHTLGNFGSDSILARIQIASSFYTGHMGLDWQGMYVGTPDAGMLRFRTDSIDRIVINANGSVGIGTASPAARLHVHNSPGSVVAVFSAAFGTAQINITNNTHTAQVGLDGLGAYINAPDSKDVRFRTNSADRMVIKDGTGNIGIGLFNPNTKLHVNGDAIIEQKLVVNDTAVATSLRVTGAIASTSVNININSGPQNINPGNKSYLLINNTGVAPATITLTDGLTDGQILYIVAASSGGGSIQFIDNTLNNTQLSSNYPMGIDDTLTLIWNDSRNSWIELHRSVN
jgi:hypothetical protein